MIHLKAVFLKFIFCLVLLYIILGIFYGVSFGMVFLISLFLASSSYMIGEFLVLPRTNNTIATLFDFVFAFFLIWASTMTLTLRENIVVMSLVAAAGVAILEVGFHKFMANNVIKKTTSYYSKAGRLQFQAEASEELTPSKTDIKMVEEENNSENNV